MLKRLLLIVAMVFFSFSVCAEEPGKEPIKIGEINSYSTMPDYSQEHIKGVQLALEEINQAGGVLGRPLEVLSRDDKGDAAEGVRVAQELLDRDGVSLLMGTVFDHVKLAVSNLAGRRKIPFFCSSAGTDKMIWQEGNDYAVRLDSTTLVGMRILAAEAAQFPAKKWAIISPTLEYGLALVEDFKQELSKLRPDVVFVEEQWFTFGKLDAGAAVGALKAAEPDALLSAVAGADLPRFIRQGTLRGLFAGKKVVAPWVGFPTHLEPLGKEAPVGWVSNGLPYNEIKSDGMKAFTAAYTKRFGKAPKDSALMGYISLKSVVAAIQRAGVLDPQKIAAAARGSDFETPIGPLHYRTIDGQSTLGLWVGKTGFKDGVPALVDWHYVEPTPYFPSDEEILKMRSEGK